MCKAVEDYGNQIAKEKSKEIAIKLLKKGQSIEDVADTVDLSIETIKEIKKENF